MSVRDRLLARLAELAGLAEAATPGPWTVSRQLPSPVVASPVVDGARLDAHVLDINGNAEADSAFIAVHSPSLAGAVWEGLRRIVELHNDQQVCVVYCGSNSKCDGTEDAPCADSNDGEHQYPACGECRASGSPDHYDDEFYFRYPCPTIKAVMAALGVGADDGGTETPRCSAEGSYLEGWRCALPEGHDGTHAIVGDPDAPIRADSPPAAPRLPLDAGLRHAVPARPAAPSDDGWCEHEFEPNLRCGLPRSLHVPTTGHAFAPAPSPVGDGEGGR